MKAPSKKKDYLVVERVNPDTSDTEKIEMTLVANGDRLNFLMSIKPEGRTLWKEKVKVGYTREGVTFGVEAAARSTECVVTGGVGTIPVTLHGHHLLRLLLRLPRRLQRKPGQDHRRVHEEEEKEDQESGVRNQESTD